MDRSIETMELFCKLVVAEEEEERCRQITNWMNDGRKLVQLVVASRKRQEDAESPLSPEDLDSSARDIFQAVPTGEESTTVDRKGNRSAC